MKYYLLPVLSFLLIFSAKAADKDSTVYYNLHDSVKAVQFLAEVNVQADKRSKFLVGIKTDLVSLAIMPVQETTRFVFQFPDSAQAVEKGINVSQPLPFVMTFDYPWDYKDTCRFLICTASDSAENFSLYSSYVFFPKENKWKLIGTCRIRGQWGTIRQPASFVTSWKDTIRVNTDQVWIQRNNGSWKNMKNETLPNPTINLFGHIDSVKQHEIDMQLIGEAIASGNSDAMENVEGVFYKIIKEGTGRQVSINDTVTVLYKLTLLNDGSLVSETKDKPATFSLKRLIRGWQIGVPLCKVGGKIKLVIPSDLAYSIRTRAARIPPNSILVFEIEVVDAKSPL